MSEYIPYLAAIFGVVMSLGYYPQARRLWKSKSAENISIPSFTIFSIGTLTWFIYGLYLRDWVVALSFIIGVIGSWTVLILALSYRKNGRRLPADN